MRLYTQPPVEQVQALIDEIHAVVRAIIDEDPDAYRRPRPAARPTVLIVDDNVDIRLLVRVLLESSTLNVQVVGEAVDGADALAKFATMDPPDVPDVVILDNQMPGPEGIDIAATMLATEPRQQIVLFSAYLTPDLLAHAEAVGVRACLNKENYEELPDIVQRLSARPR